MCGRRLWQQALTTAEMEAIANIVRKYPDVVVVADEVYDHIEFVGGHKRFASIDGMYVGVLGPLGLVLVLPVGHLTLMHAHRRFDRTVTMSSAAKTFSVTGWKIGYGPHSMLVAMPCRSTSLIHPGAT